MKWEQRVNDVDVIRKSCNIDMVQDKTTALIVPQNATRITMQQCEGSARNLHAVSDRTWIFEEFIVSLNIASQRKKPSHDKCGA